MKYLVDTNVLSEIRKGTRCNASVAEWWSSINQDDVFISILTIGEIRKGIEKARRRDAGFAASLEKWLSLVTSHYRDRIIEIDLEVAEEWGRLSVPNPLPAVDGLIAATAKIKGLTLVTRNVRDIARTDVAFLNPWP
ncbi:MAG TPA: type II toxin-antitoxin system VapC family toxin [Thermoanaerobaculia bacterium]